MRAAASSWRGHAPAPRVLNARGWAMLGAIAYALIVWAVLTIIIARCAA